MSDVAERVKKIVVEHLGVDADKVVDGANFMEDLGADSSTRSNSSWRSKRSSASRFRMMPLKPS